MPKSERGFASMDRAKQRQIASKGGVMAHKRGTAHEWTSQAAREAGKKGGIASAQAKRERKTLVNTAEVIRQRLINENNSAAGA